MTTDTIEKLTRAEIRRQIDDLAQLDAELVREAAELFRTHGFAKSDGLTDFERKVAAEARLLLGLPTPAAQANYGSRDTEIKIRRAAIERAIKLLRNEEMEAQAIEAATWAADARPKWRALCKEIALQAIKLERLNALAEEMVPSDFAMFLDMGAHEYFGGRISIVFQDRFEMREMIAGVIEQGILTRAEIKKAQTQ